MWIDVVHLLLLKIVLELWIELKKIVDTFSNFKISFPMPFWFTIQTNFRFVIACSFALCFFQTCFALIDAPPSSLLDP
jgi:hypothetical protein